MGFGRGIVYFVNVQDVQLGFLHGAFDQSGEAGEDSAGQQLVSGAVYRGAEIYAVRETFDAEHCVST